MTDDELLRQIRSALVHMHDPPHLETHPLARRIEFVSEDGHLSRGRALQRMLRRSIAALAPGEALASGVLEARAYQVLYDYAVSKRSITAIAASQGISRRQAYRELRCALEALANVLADVLHQRASGGGDANDVPGRFADVRGELARLSEITDGVVNIGRLLEGIVENVSYLAREKGVHVEMETTACDLLTLGNRVMLRQALLNLLSHTVDHHYGARVTVRTTQDGDWALVTLGPSSLREDLELHPDDPYSVAKQLLESLGIKWYESTSAVGRVTTSLRIPLCREYRVLLVDDNQGVINLLRSYLRLQPYRVSEAGGFEEALAAIGDVEPDAVILDIMMPGRDGWELLQTLRASRSGRFRVIVCSVINDPHLATALGADAFLLKPVDRATMVQTLERVLASA